MRETKKLPAVLLALVLFFTLSVPALAAAAGGSAWTSGPVVV